MKISIIGAGPAGSFAAYNLADKYDVEIFEKKSEIGLPIQCSGLVTETIKSIDKIFRSKDFERLVENKIKKVGLFSKNEKCEITLKEPDYVLKRDKFDKWLVNLAKKKGAKINLNHEFIKYERKKDGLWIFVKHKNKIKKIKTDILIGADGPFSKVSNQLGNSREFIQCIQADIKYKGDKGKMDIFFSEKYKELFAWIVPKTPEVAEIGLGCKYNTAKKFREFLKQQKIRSKILKYTGGCISLYNHKQKNSDKNVFLVGEATSFVKASTLGGIISSLKSSKILANTIKNNKNYEKMLWKLKKEMLMHYMARKILNKFNDSDYDYLLTICKNNRLKKIFSEHSRDEYSKKVFALKALLIQPKLTKFLLKLK
ncbi:MAG: NAD(P)/FAD-dependent oxidoreductase [Nanoarchaeota archaeon]|nr:NAD(P)/FAD-dependent oxidoreductase [Nanoarchaeota archaeon]